MILLLLAAVPAIAASSAPDQNRAAWQAFQRRDFPACERLAREALQVADTEQDSLQAAFASANLAAAVAMRGRLDEALEWSRRAEQTLGPEREPRVRARILVAQAILLELRGQSEPRKQAFRRARTSLGANDWPLEFAEALVKAYDWQDLGTAFTDLTNLRETARASKDPEQTTRALLALGWLEGVGGAPEVAKAFEDARVTLETRRETAVLPLVDHNLGSVLLWADRLDEAQRVYERGLAEARSVSDRRMEVILLDDLSLVFSQKEDWPRAIASDREAAARLAAIAEDVTAGRLEDSLLLDLRRLFKARYTHKPQLLIDLFLGLFDQLAVEPLASRSGR